MWPWKCNSGIALHCCKVTKYFILLLTIILIKYYECVSVYCGYPTCKFHIICTVLCHLWPVWLHLFFPHYFINGTIFQKKVIVQRMCILIFSTVFVYNISHSENNFARYYKCKVPVILVRF